MIAARCRSDSIPPTNTPKRNNTMKKTEGQEIATMDEFETTVDLALEKQTELEKLQKAAKTAKAKVEAAKKLLQMYMEPSESYARANEDALFPDPDNQRAETENAAYGFKRNANRSVVLADGLDDDAVIAKIERSKSLPEELKDEFVIREPKLSRQSIIQAVKSERVSAKQLKAVGISVDNAKTFYVAPKDAA